CFCLVDSVDGVEQLARCFGAAGTPLNVLLELGVPGGRTGVRDDAPRDAVLAAIARHAGVLELAGIELSEGVLKEDGEIRAFLRRAVKLVHE
ncbi:amino acid deaminase, partial [Burkholderia pseudomallei]